MYLKVIFILNMIVGKEIFLVFKSMIKKNKISIDVTLCTWLAISNVGVIIIDKE